MTMLAYFTENRSVGVQNRKSMTSLRLVADTPLTVILNHNFLSASNAPFVTGNKRADTASDGRVAFKDDTVISCLERR